MCIDLSLPLVPSMGLHDPLDAFVTYLQLEATASRMTLPPPAPNLDERIVELAAMVDTSALATSDPLGLGGLLADAARLTQIDGSAGPGREILDAILSSALDGLMTYDSEEFRRPATQRLAFREVGLAIGLRAFPLLREHTARDAKLASKVDRLERYRGLADDIESFWRDPQHRLSSTWTEHRDINEVMLATSLTPGGFLALRRPPGASS